MQRKEKVETRKNPKHFFPHSVISDLLLRKILNKIDDSATD